MRPIQSDQPGAMQTFQVSHKGVFCFGLVGGAPVGVVSVWGVMFGRRPACRVVILQRSRLFVCASIYRCVLGISGHYCNMVETWSQHLGLDTSCERTKPKF